MVSITVATRCEILKSNVLVLCGALHSLHEAPRGRRTPWLRKGNKRGGADGFRLPQQPEPRNHHGPAAPAPGGAA